MRIGMLIDHPFNAPLGYSIRPRELCMRLAESGCEVHVFSPVDVDRKISDNLYLHGNSSFEAYFLGSFHKLLRKAFKSPSSARFLYRKKTLEILAKRFAESMYNRIKDCNVDLIQGEKEIAAMAASYLGKQLGIPVVSDIHGLLAEEAVQYGFIKSDSKEYIEVRSFVSNVLRNSDAVVVVSDCLKKYLACNFDYDIKKIFVVSNAGLFRNVVRPSRPVPCNIVYAGILEPWEKVDLAIGSMVYVSNVYEKSKLLIAGDGSLRSELIGLSKRLKLEECVNFVGTVPYENISDFLIKGDVAVLPSTKDVVRKVACPIKLFDYLAAGLPVVTVSGLWWSDFVKTHKVGLVVEDTPKSFAEAINKLLSSPDTIDAIGKNAIDLVKNQYNWREMAKKLLKVYNELL